MHIRSKFVLTASILALGVTTLPVSAQIPKVCQKISGTTNETLIPQEAVPNDPFGRVLGLFTGSFGGATNAAVTAFLVTPPTFSAAAPAASQIMTVRHAFLTGPGDVVTTLGKAIFNPGPASLPGQTVGVASSCPGTPCVVENPQILDITGGTGRWAGASGQIRSVGVGNLNLPQGQGAFTYLVQGEVCLPATSTFATVTSPDKF